MRKQWLIAPPEEDGLPCEQLLANFDLPHEPTCSHSATGLSQLLTSALNALRNQLKVDKEQCLEPVIVVIFTFLRGVRPAPVFQRP